MCEIEETLNRNLCVFYQDELFGRNTEITANEWNNGEGVDLVLSIIEKDQNASFNKRTIYVELTYSELEILGKVINKLNEEG